MAQIFVSAVAHFFVVVSGSKIHERAAHFFIDIYRGHFLFPTTCREVGFQNSVQLGQNYFFEFFLEMLLKMPFSSATTGRDFF